MKIFLPSLTALTLSAASFLPAAAEAQQPPVPTVREGSFHCFRGLPESQINYLPAELSKASSVRRADKLGNSKFDNTDGHDLREVPTEGDYPVLVILVGFSDVKFSQNRDDPRSLMDDMLNGSDFSYQNATGSANAFYQTISNGQFNPIFDVVGPVMLPENEAFYVFNDGSDKYTDASGNQVNSYRPGRMIEAAVKAIDDQVDFSKYDSNGDGYADFVYVFYAGRAESTSSTTRIWPHAFTLTSAIGGPVELDGVKIDRYATSPELNLSANRLSGIGTFCHEFAHVLGLPDLYDTSSNTGNASKCFTPGSFDTMDAGNYNNDEHTPCVFSVYEQYSMEWMKPVTITGGGSFTLLPLEAYPFGYKINSTNNPQEYFILESRGNGYYDQYLEGRGLLVWHIDFVSSIWNNNAPNNSANRQRIDIIEADNKKEATSRAGDTFPGSAGICEFSANLSPSFTDWSNNPVGYNLRQIRYNFDGTSSFQIQSVAGATMDGAEIGVATPHVAAARPDGFLIEWPEVDGANAYFISVFDMDEFSGQSLPYSAYAEGYYFRNVGEADSEDGVCSALVEGLQGNKRYGVMVYAVNDINASRMEWPLEVATVDPADYANAAANLYLSTYEDQLIAEWDAIEGTKDYTLCIATEANSATDTPDFSFDFSGRLPENWSGNGSFESSDKHAGAAAPAYKLPVSEGYLQSEIFSGPISEVTFWSKKRYSDDPAALNIYGADAQGRWTLLTTLTDLYYLEGSKEGNADKKVRTLQLPAGVYGIKFGYAAGVTDLVLHLDDIRLTFGGEPVSTPVVEAQIESLGETSAAVSGLEPEKEYVAYVVANNADGVEATSRKVRFTMEGLPKSGVSEIAADTAAAASFSIEGLTVIPSDSTLPYSIYTADGLTVASGVKGHFTLPARGFYILSLPGKSLKINI